MQDVNLTRLGVDAQRAARELPFVRTDGKVVYGHQAIAAALLTGNLALKGAGRVLGSSLLERPMAAAYSWIAQNRGALPGGTAACAIATSPAGNDGNSGLGRTVPAAGPLTRSDSLDAQAITPHAMPRSRR